jgi:NAD(P)-dependent dehydrogenase (short-subunit alcohol dehydrogenase family)
MARLAGKTVVLTGACGTIGEACLDALLAGGARVLLTDRAAPPAAWLEREGLHFVAADVTDSGAVDAAFAAGLAHFGQIDAAVLAAGIEGGTAPVEDIPEPDLDRVLAVNLKGSLFWMQACLRHMKPRGAGSIVALSSISGVVGSPMMAPYTISKHAVIGLVRAAALETGRYGVRVNAVCPGPVDSEMMRRIDDALSARNPGRLKGQPDAAKALPLQRYVTAGEVAAMVAFLCSDESSSCHGGAYMVDGGFTAK